MGFITDPLPDSVKDWKCIVDLCGRYRCDGPRDGDQVNIAAWWSPSLKYVRFLGDWIKCPNMPSTTLPTEDQVYKWAESHDPGEIQHAKDLAKWKADKAASAKKYEDREAFMKANGATWVHVTILGPEGFTKIIDEPTLQRSEEETQKLIALYIQEKCPPSSEVKEVTYSTKPYAALEEWRKRMFR